MTSDLTIEQKRVEAKKILAKQKLQQMGGVSATSRVFGDVGPSVAQERLDNQLGERARIEQQLGAPFSSTGEFNDFFGRMGLATQENEQEKALRLRKRNPELDVRTVRTGPEGFDELTVFRAPGQEAFNPIDRPGGSFTSDIADLAGSLGNLENLGSIVATKGAGGFLSALGRSILGSLLGNEADAQIEKAQGLETASGLERSGERALAGGAALLGESLAAGGTAIKQGVRGERGLIKPSLKSQEAVRIVGENPDLPTLSAGQISPVFKRKENQAAQTGNTVLDFREQQQKQLAESIGNIAPPSKSDVFSDNALLDINNTARSTALEQAGERAGSEELVRQAGRGLQEARESLVETKRAEKNRLFEEAFSKASDDISFNIGEAKKEAQNAIKGVTGRSTDPETGAVSDVRIGENFSPAMKNALETLDKLDEVVKSDKPQEAFEQIKALRTQFFDLSQPDPTTGRFTNEARIASSIRRRLTDALQNPAGGAEEFVGAFKNASKANVEFENLINTQTLKDIARSENPQQLFGRIVSSGNFEQLSLLEKELKPAEFRKLGTSFDEFLRVDPKSINKTLDSFAKDKDSLRKLIPETREKQLRVLGNAVERLDNAPSVKVLKSTGDAGERALKIMEGGSDEQFKAFVDAAIKANPSKENDTKAALLHGVVTKILEKNKSLKDGRIRYNMNKISEELDTLIQKGRLKQIANPRTVQALKDRGFIASVLGASEADVGASMSGASVASEAVSVNPAEAVGGFLGVAHNEIWARVLTHPTTVRILAGSGRQSNQAVDKGIQHVSRLLGIAADDINNAPRIDFKDEAENEN